MELLDERFACKFPKCLEKIQEDTRKIRKAYSIFVDVADNI